MINNQEPKLIIFDGTSVLNDFYHRTLTNEFSEWKKGKISEEEGFSTLLKSVSGKYINGVQGFFKSLFELIDLQKPSHLIVVWGSLRENSFRKSIYSNYKNYQNNTDYPLIEQIETTKNILSSIGVVQYSSSKYESLDLAGSIAREFSNDISIQLFTRNSNALQLAEFTDIWIKTKNAHELAKNLSLDLSLYPKNYILYNKDLVKKIIGLNFDQIIDYKAVIGNPKIGIPGAKGIGKEGIIPLLQHYNSLEEIYKELEFQNQSKLNNLWRNLSLTMPLKRNPFTPLVKYKEDVLISKKLVTIKTDIFSSLTKENNQLSLCSTTLNIDISKAVDELKKIDLSPVINDSDKSNKDFTFSSLIQTYNHQILSPSSQYYVGNNISNIAKSNLGNLSSIIFLPKLNNIKNLQQNTQSSIESFDLNNNSDITNNLESIVDFSNYTTKKDISTINRELAISTINTDLPNVNSILKTLPGNSLLKNLLNLDDSSKLGASKVNNAFTLLDSFTLSKYQCSFCQKEFITSDFSPNYCPNCGYSLL